MNSATAGGGLLTLENHLSITLRDVLTGKETRRFDVEPANRSITAWACSRGGEVVAAVSGPSWKLHLWDGHTGKLVASHPAPPHVYWSLFSPDGATVAAVDQSEGVYLIERTTGTIRRIVPSRADDRRQRTMAFSPDSTRLATAAAGRVKEGDPDSIAIWEDSDRTAAGDFPGAARAIGEPGIHARGSIIADIEQVGRTSVAAGDGRRRQERSPPVTR